MDRIMDSGSIDWGSTPHERTKGKCPVVLTKMSCRFI